MSSAVPSKQLDEKPISPIEKVITHLEDQHCSAGEASITASSIEDESSTPFVELQLISAQLHDVEATVERISTKVPFKVISSANTRSLPNADSHPTSVIVVADTQPDYPESRRDEIRASHI